VIFIERRVIPMHVHLQNDSTGKAVKKGEAALHVWSHALLGEDEREEVFKTGCAANLAVLLDRGDDEERYGAMGCISALALSEKHIIEVASNKASSQYKGSI